MIAITDDVSRCDTAGYSQRLDWETENFVAHSLRAEGYDASEDGTGRGTPIIPIQNALRRQDQNGLGIGASDDPMFTLDQASQHAIAFSSKDYGADAVVGVSPTTANIRAASGGSSRSYVAERWAVRRLTPTECERLQGFPDGFTDIRPGGKPTADGPRYKALGNSMAVNVMSWIGQRIAMVNAVEHVAEAAE